MFDAEFFFLLEKKDQLKLKLNILTFLFHFLTFNVGIARRLQCQQSFGTFGCPRLCGCKRPLGFDREPQCKEMNMARRTSRQILSVKGRPPKVLKLEILLVKLPYSTSNDSHLNKLCYLPRPGLGLRPRSHVLSHF